MAVAEDRKNNAEKARKEIEQLLSPDTAKKPTVSGSLRAKGFLAFVAVAIYAVLLTTFTYYKKAELLVEFERLQNFHKLEDLLRQVDEAAVQLAISNVSNAAPDSPEVVIQRFQVNFDALNRKNTNLTNQYPSAGIDLKTLESLLKQIVVSPSAAGVTALNTELLKVKSDLNQRLNHAVQEQSVESKRYIEMWDQSSLTLMTFGLVGLIFLGAVIGLFFTRLTEDLVMLKKRALNIVYGERQSSASIERNDEVAELMQAVNYMAYALDEREKELVIARQRYFYQEKMAAVGALAAGVAHEIGNPIAAMSGVLQEMSDEQDVLIENGGVKDERIDTLKAQIRRLSGIIREISGFASPQSAERDLLDLNGLIRTDVRLMSYDKRMQHVNVQMDLDPQMPAIYGVADQLTQVVMNFLINAADALEGVSSDQKSITVTSQVLEEKVKVSVSDNGCGMSPETITRAFEAFYTTKKRGTGLGLALCYSIINEHGGSIDIESELGKGTRVTVTLPIDPRSNVNRSDNKDEWHLRTHDRLMAKYISQPNPFPKAGSTI